MRNRVSDIVSVVFLGRRENIDRKYYNCVLIERQVGLTELVKMHTKMSVQTSSACGKNLWPVSLSVYRNKICLTRTNAIGCLILVVMTQGHGNHSILISAIIRNTPGSNLTYFEPRGQFFIGAKLFPGTP